MHHKKSKREIREQSEFGVFSLLITFFMILLFAIGALASGGWPL